MGTLAKWGIKASLACFTAIVTLLALVAAVSTTAMEVLSSEKSYLLPDNPLLNVAALALALALLCILARGSWHVLVRLRSWLATQKGFRVARIALLAAIGALACTWAYVVRPEPWADQGIALDIARQTLAGDWSELDVGGYLSCYPFQIGLVLVLRCFVRLFGERVVLAFWLFNAAGLVLLYASLCGIAARLGAGRLTQLFVLALGIVFWPPLQYVTFVYGTVWSLALAVLAMRLEIDCLGSPSGTVPEGLPNARVCFVLQSLGSAVAICLAILFKENTKVFLIAMLLVAVAELACRADLRLVLVPCLLVAGLLVASIAPRAYVERISGKEVPAGCSPWSYVAMGMQEVYADCGWYTAYNDRTYRAAGDDATKQAKVAQQEIGRLLVRFQKHPLAAVRFYSRKIASEWNNPTFQGLWVAQVCDPTRPLGSLGRKLMGQRATELSGAWLNLVLFCVLAGALAWAVLTPWDDERTRRGAVLPIAFVGGFLVHVVWEAKTQYTLPYFVLLLPLAVMGLRALALAIHRKEVPVIRRAPVVAAGAVCVLFALYCACGFVSYLTCDQAPYAWYLATHPVPWILRAG